MRITDNTVNTKIKNLFTMTIESKTKTTLKLITLGNNKRNLQKNYINLVIAAFTKTSSLGTIAQLTKRI